MSIFKKQGSDRNRDNTDDKELTGGAGSEKETNEGASEEISGKKDTSEDKASGKKLPARKKRSAKLRRGRYNARKKKKKSGEKKPLGKKPFIIAGSIVGGLILVYLCVAAFFMSHFLVNTTINGKDFSGKTVADVESYLESQVEGYQLKLIEQDNETDTISGSDISLVYVKNNDVEKALEDQSQLLWIASFFSKSNTDITVGVEYDEAALDAKIQTIKAVTGEQTEPTSAHPEYDGNSFVVAAETFGSAVDLEKLSSKIKEYISSFKPQLNLLDEKCYDMPKYTSESPEVQAACDTMNQYLKASITYTMDEDVVVDKELISTWLSYDENMNVTFNEDAVKKWMREFGSKYDTVGKTRSITTPGGKTAEVSGGTYGWSVDEKKEAENLINSIKKGEVTSREPAYEQKAASRSAQDWGTTYVEVDLSAQHMWYIVDGSVALETDVVTGLASDPNRVTPQGVYSILEMMRNKTLVGETDPATGKPSYETPVAFWMPFTWQGHGFHDATWQPSFGGSRYLTNGSHGCVNMPVDKAGNLFSMISAGTPVVIHY